MITKDGRYACEHSLKALTNSESVFSKIKDAPRITRFGKFLLDTGLDELPQLINVLRGDLSLVGNRPLPLYEAEKLTTDKDALRFLAPAGIIGWWQATNRERKYMCEKEQIELDKRYALEHSFLHDLKLLFKTFAPFFQKEKDGRVRI